MYILSAVGYLLCVTLHMVFLFLAVYNYFKGRKMNALYYMMWAIVFQIAGM